MASNPCTEAGKQTLTIKLTSASLMIDMDLVFFKYCVNFKCKRMQIFKNSASVAWSHKKTKKQNKTQKVANEGQPLCYICSALFLALERSH